MGLASVMGAARIMGLARAVGEDVEVSVTEGGRQLDAESCWRGARAMGGGEGVMVFLVAEGGGDLDAGSSWSCILLGKYSSGLNLEGRPCLNDSA